MNPKVSGLARDSSTVEDGEDGAKKDEDLQAEDIQVEDDPAGPDMTVERGDNQMQDVCSNNLAGILIENQEEQSTNMDTGEIVNESSVCDRVQDFSIDSVENSFEVGVSDFIVTGLAEEGASRVSQEEIAHLLEEMVTRTQEETSNHAQEEPDIHIQEGEQMATSAAGTDQETITESILETLTFEDPVENAAIPTAMDTIAASTDQETVKETPVETLTFIEDGSENSASIPTAMDTSAAPTGQKTVEESTVETLIEDPESDASSHTAIDTNVEVLTEIETNEESLLEADDTTEEQEMSVSVPAPSYQDPEGIFQWRSAIAQKRSLDCFDDAIQNEIDIYCKLVALEGNAQYLIRTQPVRLLAFQCIKSVHCASKGCFNEAYKIILRTRNLFRLYYEECEDLYDFDGIFYFLNHTLQQIHDEGGSQVQNPNDLMLQPVLSWEDLSPEAQSVVFGVQLYYYLLLREPPKVLLKLSKMILTLSDSVPEWHLLHWAVLRTKRLQSSLIIEKPKKLEMDALRKALDLDPSNIAVRIALVTSLFDWMRTDDRHPQIEIMGEYLKSVNNISRFVHIEIQDILASIASSEELQVPVAQIYEIETNLIASSFYGYRNLADILELVSDEDIVEECQYVVIDDDSYRQVLTRTEAQEMANACLKFVLRSDPNNTVANVVNAYRLLRMFQRDLALNVLRICKAQAPFNESVAMSYVRSSVGGSTPDREEALQFLNQALSGNFQWPDVTTAHFYFLKGILHWLSDVENNVESCVKAWVQGLHFNPVFFLCQFSFWTKTHVRKYLWPSSLANFAIIESLKLALRSFHSVTPNAEPGVLAACAVFLKELDELFPLTTSITKTIAQMSKRWFYLLEAKPDDSDDDEDHESVLEQDAPAAKRRRVQSDVLPVKGNLVVKRNPVMKSSPVVKSSPVIKSSPVVKSSPVIKSSQVVNTYTRRSNLIEIIPREVFPAKLPRVEIENLPVQREANTLPTFTRRSNLIQIIPQDQVASTSQPANHVELTVGYPCIDLASSEDDMTKEDDHNIEEDVDDTENTDDDVVVVQSKGTEQCGVIETDILLQGSEPETEDGTEVNDDESDVELIADARSPSFSLVPVETEAIIFSRNNLRKRSIPTIATLELPGEIECEVAVPSSVSDNVDHEVFQLVQDTVDKVVQINEESV